MKSLVLLDKFVEIPDIWLSVYKQFFFDLDDLCFHVVILLSLTFLLLFFIFVVTCTCTSSIFVGGLGLNNSSDNLLLCIWVNCVITEQRNVGTVLQEALQILFLIGLVNICELLHDCGLLHSYVAFTLNTINKVSVCIQETLILSNNSLIIFKS